MAMIQKIRDRSTLLITVIGVAMILFLLGGDFLSSGGGNFARGNENDVLIVDGKSVSYQEFQQRINTEIQRMYGNNTVSQSERDRISNVVWNYFLSEKIYGTEYSELGLNVTGDELFNRIRMGASRILQQQFSDGNGSINPNFADQFGRLDGNKVLAAVKQTMSNPETEGQWLRLEQSLKQERYQSKYYTLIKKGIGVTSAEAEAGMNEQSARVAFSYVAKMYNEVDDSQVQITDADLQKYYEAHKGESNYQQQMPSRGLEYIIFQVNPSVEDIAAIENELTDLKPYFEEEKDDTSFVNENAETAYNVRYYNEGSFPKDIDSLIFSAEAGVFGPFLNGNTYQLAKIIGSKTTPDSANARHIWIQIEDKDTTKAMALADSLKKVINSKDNFAEMALEFSKDLSTTPDSGKLGWFTEFTCQVRDQDFVDACFKGKVGEVQIVESQFGIHLVEVLEQTEPKAKKLVAIVDRPLVASSATKDKVYDEASKFSIDNSNSEDFRKNGNPRGIRVADRVLESDKGIAGLESSRDLVRWAYEASPGEVSDRVFEFGDKFVVAHLKEVREAGTLGLDVESVKQDVRLKVINEKKGEMIAAEMSKYSALKEAAKGMGKTVEEGSNATFYLNSVPGIGTETKLLGALFNLPQGQMSKPIVDKSGVYLVVVNSVTPVENGNLAVVRAQLQRSAQAKAEYEIGSALQNSVDLVDNRGKFY